MNNLNNILNQTYTETLKDNQLKHKANADPIQFNLNKIHPLIKNVNEFFYYKKYVSISSEDRDIVKYPNPAIFEIELPQQLGNILGVSLSSWTFPANYYTFSTANCNLIMTFKITNAYNPGENSYSSPLQEAIFEALYYNMNENYVVIISEGFYTPEIIVVELTNRFNAVVDAYIIKYFKEHNYSNLIKEFLENGGYNQFVIVYNSVQQKIWFGNKSCEFILTNDSREILEPLSININCFGKNSLPEFSNWGLPSFVGLKRCPEKSVQTEDTPRFYYGNVNHGDNGYWLLPDANLPGSKVNYIQCPLKINIMGPSNMYMEIVDFNCVDETSPYNLSKFTQQTNETNGRVNSCFAKIPIPTTPLSQWFDNGSLPTKYYMPPLENIRKLQIKLRYHNGQLVNFDNFEYSFMLEFILMVPNIERRMNVFNPIFI
jgi:hypothetical protein